MSERDTCLLQFFMSGDIWFLDPHDINVRFLHELCHLEDYPWGFIHRNLGQKAVGLESSQLHFHAHNQWDGARAAHARALVQREIIHGVQNWGVIAFTASRVEETYHKEGGRITISANFMFWYHLFFLLCA